MVMKVPKKFTVLIAYDDLHLSDALQRMLDVNRFKVVGVTSDANEAYEVMKEQKPDIVIVDLCFEDGNSIDLLTNFEVSTNLEHRPYVLVVTSFYEGQIFDVARKTSDFIYGKQNTLTATGVNRHLKTICKTLGKGNGSRPRGHLSGMEMEDNHTNIYREKWLKTRIENELNLYDMGKNRAGRKYLVEALYRALIVPEDKKITMNELYEQMSEVIEMEPKTFDSAIYRLLKETFTTTDEVRLEKINTLYQASKKSDIPTTRDFVTHLVNKIKQEECGMDTSF